MWPVALTLEGVGGELDLACPGTGEVPVPVDVLAAHVELGRCRDAGRRLGAPLAQGRNEDTALRVGDEAVLSHG